MARKLGSNGTNARIAGVLALALVVAACGKDDPNAAGGPGGNMPPPEVGVVVVRPSSVPLVKDLVGRLSAYRSADVRARVPGVLQRRVYEEGSDVKEGQLLFVIDPAPLQAALGQAVASEASAQANYANARAAAERARNLAPQKFISQSDLDNALAAERSASASLQSSKAAVAAARINLGYASVRSPINGRAGKQQVTEGALVGQADATLLTTVDQIDQMYVDFSMSVDELTSVRQANTSGTRKVQVLLPDGTPFKHDGTLDFSADTVDPSTGAVALRARVPNPDHLLLPGTFVTVRATLGLQNNAYRIPALAVQRDVQSAYVMVVGKDGKVTRKNIVPQRQEGADFVVNTGVAPGDQVIVSGLQRVQPGAPAKAVPYVPEKQSAGNAPAAQPQG
ncbi:RND efflux system, membrane fusion protein CmeA [Lysobacter dokdonensis DS-58]|uniref:RND efflux system, membrane fusion protein CmeA n=1 Tax=Lysobacter dokdonensis DS-58 TaxID=1300345 RepID=A0A0A2WEM4_9GAMM|nr:efflux RND transporter periplasmic adaptor subunit [Lysobacter dokdonensis]KGQ18188.1 RND efflux system, membrane fusion protein CmeA [Lysobacter dokdonensis DS-58]